MAVPGLKNQPESVTLLAGGQALSAQTENGSQVIAVPEKALDPYVSVIKLDIKGDLDIDAVMPEQDGNPTNGLAPVNLPLFSMVENGLLYVHPQRSDDTNLIYTVETTTNLISES
ncbi:MAG TPA: hypothetical protein VJ904_07155 [Tichowtungia sp.]|nr:hypothetical protein [Tichowtungia sp.]